MLASNEMNPVAQQSGNTSVAESEATIGTESERLMTTQNVARRLDTPAPEAEGHRGSVHLEAVPRVVSQVRTLQEQCRKLCVSTFFCEHAPVYSLGFTSALAGEGKSFLATMTAGALAADYCRSVTLLECNWDHPSLHRHFEVSLRPGLADWLRGECAIADVRHRVSDDLTIIPAGGGEHSAARLLQKLNQQGTASLLAQADELLIVDLPSVLTTAYGRTAASLVEALVMVVRAGMTPDALVAEACSQLRDLPLRGVALNQVKSRIPRWIRQLL